MTLIRSAGLRFSIQGFIDIRCMNLLIHKLETLPPNESVFSPHFCYSSVQKRLVCPLWNRGGHLQTSSVAYVRQANRNPELWGLGGLRCSWLQRSFGLGARGMVCLGSLNIFIAFGYGFCCRRKQHCAANTKKNCHRRRTKFDARNLSTPSPNPERSNPETPSP